VTVGSARSRTEASGLNVYTTDLGEEGIDLGKLYDYDIILLDLNLPDMSGYEVLRSLRVSKVKTPILILTGLGGIEDKVRGLGFGADDYMTKPFHKDELVTVFLNAICVVLQLDCNAVVGGWACLRKMKIYERPFRLSACL
jgi:two-component system, cell cycle response regulator CtrA